MNVNTIFCHFPVKAYCNGAVYLYLIIKTWYFRIIGNTMDHPFRIYLDTMDTIFTTSTARKNITATILVRRSRARSLVFAEFF